MHLSPSSIAGKGKQMMKVFLRPNFARKQAIAGAISIAETLLSLGLEPLLSIEDAARLPAIPGCTIGKTEKLLHGCDVIMPIGGDGTVIRESLAALSACKPVLGVNAGRLGFLNHMELSELDSLSRLKEGAYTLSKRMLLEAKIGRGDTFRTYTALNDIVISRGEINQILDISVFDTGGERLIIRQRADGIIFATPTGSTAYSYSAGGPVVSPEMEAVLLTGVAPHTPFRSGMVLPTSMEYFVKEAHDHEKSGFGISVDGDLVERVQPGEDVTITVRKSQRTVEFMDLGLRDFYRNLNDKMMTI